MGVSLTADFTDRMDGVSLTADFTDRTDGGSDRGFYG